MTEEIVIIMLLVLAGVFFVKVLGNIMTIMEGIEKNAEAKKDCPPHKWQYVMVNPESNDVSRMVCAKCGFRAGSE